MANRGLTNSQLQLIARQSQVSVELLEVDWGQSTGLQAQGFEDGYLTITPGGATTLKYGNASTWAACTHTGVINIISSPSGTETIDYLKRLSFKFDAGWKVAVGYTLQYGFVDVSNVNPTITALIEGGKFYIQLHYNSAGFYLFDSSNNLITSTSVIKHDYGMDFAFSNGIYPITYNSKVFLPMGTFISYTEIEEQVDFQVNEIVIALNGIDYIHSKQNGETYGFDYFNYDADYQSYLGDDHSKYAVTKLNNPVWRFLVDDYQSRPVRVYRAFLDHAYQVIGDPLLIFEGEMTKPVINIDPDGATTVAVTCSNQWKNFESKNGRRTNFKEQKSWADTNLSLVDRAFEYTYQNTKQIRWGAENPKVNPPTNLRYTTTAGTGGNYYNFTWLPASGTPDQYEIHWKSPSTSGTPYTIFQTTTTYWQSPLIPTGQNYSIKVFAVKDSVRSSAAISGGQETGASDYNVTNAGGYNGYYGYDPGFDYAIQP